jgi:outer membrane protein assembly factor BamB
VVGDSAAVAYPNFNEVTVNADALAGGTVWWRWHFYSDTRVVYNGYWLDDVRMEGNVPTACNVAPSSVVALTATAKDGSNKVEWVNPGGVYGSTRVRFRTDTFPTTPTDGLPVNDVAGTANAADGLTHNGLVNGTTYYYSVFVNDGSGRFSSARTVKATPELATGAVKWKFSTPATAMSSPTLNSAVYSVSNDRFIHSMNLASTGGDWPRTLPKSWKPLAMNAPSQTYAPVWNVTIAGATRVAVAASQDGRVYAVNADTGALLWSSPVLGETLQALPSAYFAAWDTSGTPLAADMVFVATRNATSANKLYALNASDGTIRWSFDNGGTVTDTLSIGAVNGGIISDAAAKRLWFTSRTRGTGTTSTVWCLDYTASGASVRWQAAAGDSDMIPIRRGTRLLVGNNLGDVKAFDATSGGAALWSFSTSDGPVKTIVQPDFAGTRLYFSTTNRVWALDDSNGTQAGLTSPWSTPASGGGSIASPSRPVLAAGKLYVGSGSGSIVTLNLATTPPTQTVRSLGIAAVGAPSYDFGNDWIHLGTEAGTIYCIAP